MTTTETQILREAFTVLHGATQRASMKLGQPAHTDFFGNCDIFDACPGQAILREAKRLRDLVVQL